MSFLFNPMISFHKYKINKLVWAAITGEGFSVLIKENDSGHKKIKLRKEVLHVIIITY